MANDLALPSSFSNAPMDPSFAGSKVDPTSIAEGITSAFPVLSIRGKVFRLKYRGEERPILDPSTGHPVQSLPVIILKASPVISKIFYEGQFVEGQRETPDCWSTNGVTPDAAAPRKQGTFCASCKQNQWGSKVVNEKNAKACQDNKRLALVPAEDPKNEMFGGPLLLRVPPASLGDMSTYNAFLQQHSHTYFSVKTELSFDFEVAHPKIKFKPLSPITGPLALTVLELQDHPQVQRMLAEAAEYVRSDEETRAAAAAAGFQPTPTQPAPQPAPPAAAAPPPPPPPPAPPATAGVAFGASLSGAPTPAATGVAFGAPQGHDPGPIPPHLQRAGFGQPAPEATAAPATNGASPTVADLQAQLKAMQGQLTEAAKEPAKRQRRATPPPSPSPTAAVPPSPPAAVGSPTMTLGDETGNQLPAGMDAALDQILSKPS